eukprot:TRINITY_DN4864_c0_g8_i1.p1 TRINITY_DN4864_c0_g8~~TRINITY_DN4864_c0_g8_i1.p1  ORF type:complete len:591 (+),score=181.69 TRINITY_DN4864_c0_g8_i1:838-2610(+)
MTYCFAYLIAFGLLCAFYYSMEYKTRYDYFFLCKVEEYYMNYLELLASMPVGIFMLDRKSKEILFYNKAIAKLARMHSEKTEDMPAEDKDRPVTEIEIMEVINNFVQKKGEGTLGTVIQNWKDETFKNKYKYKKDGHSLVYTVKGLRLTLQSQECEVFFLEDQTAFEELSKLESKYQKLYVASIVHDIRSPLNGIMGMIEKIGTLTSDRKISCAVDIARKTCQLLLFLTYDITDYSQLEAHKFKANPQKVVMREILEEVTELVSFSFKSKGLSCDTIIYDSVPVHVLIDRHRYMQILLNLLTNALKFTFKGSILIEVSYDSFGNHLVTSVTDTGIGIKTEDISHLFKLFGKLEESSDLNPQGVGFGLAMCKKLSEQLGGSIGVESKPGKGSTFTFSVSSVQDGSNAKSASSASLDEKRSDSAELCQTIAEHTFKLANSVANKVSQNELRKLITLPSTSAYGTREMVNASATPTTDRCKCNKILIVDDDYCNLLALHNYLQQLNFTADEVILLYPIGSEWCGGDREDSEEEQERVLHKLQDSVHRPEHACDVGNTGDQDLKGQDNEEGNPGNDHNSAVGKGAGLGGGCVLL